jgi:hypothetical protein
MTVKDMDGRTALRCAEILHKRVVAESLRTAGAKE